MVDNIYESLCDIIVATTSSSGNRKYIKVDKDIYENRYNISFHSGIYGLSENDINRVIDASIAQWEYFNDINAEEYYG